MQNNWFFFMDFDGRSPYIYDIEHCGPGSFVIREVFNCVSKFAGALFLSFTSVSNCQRISGNQQGSKPVKSSRSCKQAKRVTPFNQVRVLIDSRSREGSTSLVNFGKFVSSTIRYLGKDAGQLSSIPMLSLAAALVPPFDKLRSAEVLALPLENSDVQVNKHMDQAPCLNEHRQCADLSFPEINWTGYAFEAKTGIKFPSVLDNILAGENEYSLTSEVSTEVLVGTGSRSMRILRIKTLNVYAFGLYVHPDSVCEKLGPKYASVPTSELNNQPEFFEDLLREDIHMTVRLVVSCNGLKINTVRDVFEKSLRTRLLKMNPDTDYHCVTKFGSYFTTDIALPAGTTIHFRQTADGQLITEIGGREIGTVHSKDLCRAFFDMYIGDVSVPSYAKEEITRNVASIIKRC